MRIRWGDAIERNYIIQRSVGGMESKRFGGPGGLSGGGGGEEKTKADIEIVRKSREKKNTVWEPR